APTPPGLLAKQDPTTFTLTDTLTALRTHRVTAVELLEAYLERIETYDRNYNAFTQMNPDARAEAKASDERRTRAKKDVGPLDVAGMPTTSGWALTSPIADGVALVPEKDSAVVSRLREAGAVIVGKTNLPVLAGSGSNANNSAYGPTFNALNQEWAPGGSSSG